MKQTVLPDTIQNPALEEIKEKALPILREADVRKAAIFGSYVRGDNTEDSDIDILVDLPRGKTLLDLVHLKYTLEDELHKKVDVVTYGGLRGRVKDYILKYQYQIL